MEFFDKAYCIHCNIHSNRLNELKNEFQRLNLDVEIVYVDSCTKHENPVLDCSLNHVSIIENAYNNGLEHILIMENDVRFLKNIDLIYEYINNIPNDYDIILLDYIYGYSDEEIERFNYKDKTNHYINIGFDDKVWSCACYLLSRNGMKHIIDSQNNDLKQPDYYTTFKQNINDNLVRYVPRINLAIQKVFNGNLRTIVHGIDNTTHRYTIQGININDYNI